jgi:predicted small integral membrane protein
VGTPRFAAVRLRFACGVLVFLNGLYLAFVAFGNITDYDTNEPFVQHVLAMDTTNFGAEPGTNLDDDVMWRAIENDTVQTIAYIGIIAAETLGAVILLWAAVLWILDGNTGYRKARALSTLGLLVFIAIFMGGFIAIGGEWFQMWKSDAWNGLDPAFRNSALAMLTLVLVQVRTAEWETEIRK